jgi:hypothetical protein
VIDAKRDGSLEQEEKNDVIIDNVNNRFGSENFIKAMAKILANYKYKDVYTLINPKKKTK